jgi:hypothetical protein
LGTFGPLAIAPANLLFVFSLFSLTLYPVFCLEYAVSTVLVPSEIFRIFFTVVTVPISDLRSFSAFKTIPIILESCSIVGGVAVSV